MVFLPVKKVEKLRTPREPRGRPGGCHQGRGGAPPPVRRLAYECLYMVALISYHLTAWQKNVQK
eukprot:scaffold60284_cov18-Prasinocladus_malaysianus.AAC.1